MSLETEIAALTSEARSLLNYFNTKKSGIDSAVLAAIAAVPETTRTWWVDQITGSDTNTGSKDSPFKTFDKAVKSTPSSGVCNINLMSDYTITTLVRSSCAYIYIDGNGAATRPKILAKYMNTGTGSGSTELAGFLFTAQAANVELRGVELVLPSPVGAVALTDLRLCSFLRTNQASNLPPMLGVSLENMAVTMDSAFFGALIGNSTCAVCLNANTVTFPSGFGGKYISSVAAGVDPKTLSNILTNLPSL